MKVAPVSADLLIKIGLAVAVLGAGYYVFSKAKSGLVNPVIDVIDNIKHSITETFDDVMATPGRVADWAITETSTRGAAIQAANAPQSQEMQDITGRTYSNPLMNNDGMDFSLLSG